jgi:TonB family protein
MPRTGFPSTPPPWRWALLCLTLASAVAQAQALDAGVPLAPRLTRPPVLKHFVEATSPPDAEHEGLTARVVLLIDISDVGKVTQAEVVEPAGHGFDEAALAAVKQFDFEPAGIDDQPGAVRIRYAYQFVWREVSRDAGADEPDGGAQVAQEGPINFSGVARERGSRAPLVTAQVTLNDGAQTTVTDAEGRFSFRDVPVGTVKVSVAQTSYLRFETAETVAPAKETRVTYYVQRAAFSSFETVVRSAKEKKEVSQQTIEVAEIQKIPGTQGDTLKVVQNFPGVARSSFNAGAIVIRGTNANDSGVFLDGVRIPLLFHFAGLTSVFNSDLLDSVTFLPGNYSGYYGDLVGGVVDVKSRAPRKDRLGGYANVSLLETSVLLEGPLGDSVSFAVAGRRSYIDLFLGAIPAGKGPNFQVAPKYYDVQAKVEWRINKQHTLTLLGITSDDTFGLLFDRPSSADPNSAGTFNLETGFSQLRLRHQFKSGAWKLDTIAAVGITKVLVQVGKTAGLDIQSQEYDLRSTLEYEFAPSFTLAGGVDEVFQPAKISASLTQGAPGGPPTGTPTPQDSTLKSATVDANFRQYYPSLWVEGRLRLFDRWLLVPGLRSESYVFSEATSTKRTLNPRLGTRFDLGQQVTLKGGAGVYSGAPTQGEPTKAFGNPDILPKRALQFSAGAEWVPTFYAPLFVSLEGFYNRLDHLIITNPSSASIAQGGPIVTNDGIGRAYGVELLVRHQLSKRFFGWLAYTLSKSERLNGPGQHWELFSNDQTHVLTVIASYQLPSDITVGVRFRFASGNPYTPVVDARRNDATDSFSPISGAAFSQRLPSFNQADVRIDKTFTFDLWTLNVYVDITNVYNNASVEGITYNYNYTQKAYFTGLPILPILGVKGAF